jgi:L-ribulose-5-phosphate 4-epimerase
MLEQLKEKVYQANVALKENGLITLTWGNVSEIDRETGFVVIKPSGISYDTISPEDMVIVDLEGNKVEGKWNPSSDLPTHLELYRTFPEIGGVTHTHSRWATIFAQAGRSIPMLGTTHADAFYGDIPCTRKLTPEEIAGEYEKETGKIICELFTDSKPMDMPGALVYSHGPFTWGKDAAKSVEYAIILEEVAMMAYHTMPLNPTVEFQQELAEKHYMRKHGPNAYYGQKG